MSGRVCFASSGTMGSKPGLSCRRSIVAGWPPEEGSLNGPFGSLSVFSIFTPLSPYIGKSQFPCNRHQNQHYCHYCHCP